MGGEGVSEHRARCVYACVRLCFIQQTELRVMTDIVCLNHLQRERRQEAVTVFQLFTAALKPAKL